MAVKGKQIAGRAAKGKQIASKRKPTSEGNDLASGRDRKKRRSGVLQFFEDEAVDTDFDDEEEDDSENDDFRDFIDDVETVKNDENKSGKMYHLPFLLKEEELSDDERENLIKQRYGRGSGYIVYADEVQDTKDHDDRGHVMHSAKDPTIWRVKCTGGREKYIVFCLMQKYVDLKSLGKKLQIMSVFSLDHAKGFIYIEADKEYDVIEACKGLCTIYSSRLALVPKNEVPHLLSVRNTVSGISLDSWVRIKCGTYKGDLAKVVAIDNSRKRATIKLIPRIDLQALAQKFGGGSGTVKCAAVPAPRLISSRELDDFRGQIQYKRDRETGETFEVLDGLMLKNGYLYKKVSLTSLSCWEVEPSNAETQKFTFGGDASEDSEWLSVLYGGRRETRSVSDGAEFGATEGTSEIKQSGYGLHDLVLFGRREFGVIIGAKDDGFQILKGDSGRQVTVSVEPDEIKNVISDDSFTAQDSQKNVISINDKLKVLEGPFKAWQGIVKHMFKGSIFLFDDKHLENSGFFCVEPEMCEKIVASKDASDENSDDEIPPGFEDFKESPAVPESPKRSFEQSERSRAFNNNSHGDKGQTFSIGQTLRIRIGPLKGHLCRVVAVYRSEVTVKLDSQLKVLKVDCNHLAETGVKRDSLHDYSGSDFTVKPSDGDPFTVFSGFNNRETGKDETADPWGSSAGWVTGNQADYSSRGDSWEKEIPSTGDLKASWDKAVDGDKAPDSQSGSWGQNADNWDKATVKTDAGCSSSDGWKNSVVQADFPTNGMVDWEKKSSMDQADQQKKSESSWSLWDKEKPDSVNDTKALKEDNISGWGMEVKNQDNQKGVGDCTSAWDKRKDISGDETNSWGEEFQGNQDAPRGKASGSWKDVEASGGKKTDSWNDATTARKNQRGGWDSATEHWDRPKLGSDQSGGWGKAKGESGGQSNNWDKSNDASEDKAPTKKKVGFADQSQTDGWNHSKPSGGDQASNLNKWDQSKNRDKSREGNEGKAASWNKTQSSGQDKKGGWNKPTPSGGGQSSSWSKGVAWNDDAGEREKNQNERWSRPEDSTGGWDKSGHGGQSSTDSWKKEKPFGNDQASDWNKGQPDNWDKSKNTSEGKRGSWNDVGRASECKTDGWNAPKASGADQASTWDKKMAANDDVNGRQNDQSGGWNKPKDGGGWGSSWSKGMTGNTEAGGNKDGGWNNDQSGCWNKPKDDGGWGSSWSKGTAGNTEAGGNRDNEGNWNQTKSFDGGRGSGWRGGRGRNRGDGDGGRGRNGGDGGRGRGYRGDGGRGRGGRSFGRDQSSTENRDQGNYQGRGRGESSDWSSDQTSNWNKPKSFDQEHSSGWNRGGADKGKDGNNDWANSWNKSSFGEGQSSGWNKGEGTEKGGGNEKQSDSWNTPKSLGEEQSSGWNGAGANKAKDGNNDWSGSWSRSGQGSSSSWNKGAGADNEEEGNTGGTSWNGPKPFGRGHSFGRGQSSGRNGNSFGRGRGRRGQGGWNRGGRDANGGGFGSSSGADSWKQGEAASTGQWSSQNQGIASNKETWRSTDQASGGWNKESSWNEVKSSDEAGASGWNSNSNLGKDAGGTQNLAGSWSQGKANNGDGQASGWNQGAVPDKQGGNEAGGWGNKAGSWDNAPRGGGGNSNSNTWK